MFGQRGLGHKKDPIETYNETDKLFKILDIPFSTKSTSEDLRQLIRWIDETIMKLVYK